MKRLLAALLLIVAGCRPQRSVMIGTTTSVDGSGLLQIWRVEFKRQTGIEIDAFTVGSGRALKMAADGKVDLTITHDPVAEAAFVAKNRPEIYRQFMWNDFVIVGPASDPAHIAGAQSAAEAFRRIFVASAKFLSRNDQSGTNMKELALWRTAGVAQAKNANYVPLGQSMANLLRSADRLQAYTLTDRATFDQLEPSMKLKILFAGDPALRNVYAVTLMRNGGRDARLLATWILSPEGRRIVESFRIRGKSEMHWID